MPGEEEGHPSILLRALGVLLALLRALVERRRRADAYDARGSTTTRPANAYDADDNFAEGESSARDAGQLQHLGATLCDSNVTRSCIATLNASAAPPSSDFTAGALTWATTYDPSSNVATTVDPKGQSCLHAFGLLNRLSSQTYTPVAELPSLVSIAYGYTKNGSLESVHETKRMSDGMGGTKLVVESTSRTFDALERMASQTRTYGDSPAVPRTTLFGYDFKGNRTSVTDFTGASTRYTFDSVDRLLTATTPSGSTQNFYWPDGLLKRTEYKNLSGAVTTVEKRCYDDVSRLTTLASGPPNFMDDACGLMSGVFFSRFDYALDQNGNRVAQNERRASVTELTEYGYDDLDRLVATVEPAEAKLYQLDAVGNRTGEKKTTPAAARLLGLTAAAFVALAPAETLAHVRGHFNAADWLTQREQLVPAGAPINFLHDANGNTTSEQSAASLREYRWDSRNTLTAALIDGADVGRYSYDFQLQRVACTAGGSTVEYVLDDKLVLQELDSSHGATRRYHFGALSPLGVTDSAGARWLLNDGLGSVSDEVTPSGALFKQRQYNAWGEYRNSTAPALNEPKLGYEGHQYDNETSLTYARARYLDNRYGVLLSRDAVEGSINDAPTLHRYVWVRDNPLRFLDFTGNDPPQISQREYEVIEKSKTAEKEGLPVLSSKGEQTGTYYPDAADRAAVMSCLKEGGGALQFSCGGRLKERRAIESKVLVGVLPPSREEQLEQVFQGLGMQVAMPKVGVKGFSPYETEDWVRSQEERLRQLGAPESEIAALRQLAATKDPLRTVNFAIGATASLGLAGVGASEEAAAIQAERTALTEAKRVAGAVQQAEIAEQLAAQKQPDLFRNLFPADTPRPANAIPPHMLHRISGKFAYVVTEDGQLVVGRNTQLQGHIDLAGGKPVRAAGEVKVVRGEVRFVDNNSGHYKPSGASAGKEAEAAFERAGLDAKGKYINRKFE